MNISITDQTVLMWQNLRKEQELKNLSRLEETFWENRFKNSDNEYDFEVFEVIIDKGTKL